MYYPESGIIADKYPRFSQHVARVDDYLQQRHTKPFYVSQAADKLGIGINEFEAILELYRQYGVVVFQNVWLCPNDNQEIDFVSDNTLYCSLCDKNYSESQCLQKLVIQPREAPVPELVVETDSDQLLTTRAPVLDNDAPASDSPGNSSTPSLPKGRDSNIRAAYIGGAFLLISVFIAGVFGLWQGVFSDDHSSPIPSSIPTTVLVTETITVTPSPKPSTSLTTTATATPTESLGTLEIEVSPEGTDSNSFP